jgi:hypothetical protein
MMHDASYEFVILIPPIVTALLLLSTVYQPPSFKVDLGGAWDLRRETEAILIRTSS